MKGFLSKEVELTKSISIRYKMQVHEVEVEIKEDNITPEILQDIIISRFESKYCEIYGAGTEAKEAGTEVITGKVVGRYYGSVVKEVIPESFTDVKPQGNPKLKGKRNAFFEERGRLVSLHTNIFNGDNLAVGNLLSGPAIVERYGDAVLIPQGTEERWIPGVLLF